MYSQLSPDQRRQLNELLSMTTIRSDGTIDGQPNATLSALMYPQMQQQAQPMSRQELSALQMDNSEPDVFYGSGSPQQQAQHPQPRNFIRNESTGAVTDMDYAAPGGSRRGDISPVTGAPISHDPWVDGPQVLSQRQLPDGRTVKTMRVPAMDGFGRQSSGVQEVIETPDYLNPAKLKELKYKKELAGLQPKAQEANWKEVESGGKLYLINAKTGEMKPAAIGGEQLVGKPEKVKEEKPVPVSAAKGILSNRDNLRKAQTALALISGETVGDMAGDKEATGWKGYAPEAVLQRTDPKGVNTRAAIGDLGSMVIHDRSGAAVTAAEFPRLRPFIPLVTDDPAVAKKKLARFVSEYEALTEDTESFYKESGYKVPSAGKDRTTTDGAKAGGNLTPAEQTRLQELRKKYGR